MTNKYLNQIVPEQLMPHLISEKNATPLMLELLSSTSESFFDEPIEATINLGNGLMLDICIVDDIEKQKTKGFGFRRDESFSGFNNDFSLPPSYRGYCYRYLINRNKDNLKNDISEEAKDNLNRKVGEKQFAHIARIKIQQLKNAASDLSKYMGVYDDQENKTVLYVTDLLKKSLIELIQFTQKQYQWLPQIKMQSNVALTNELFSENSNGIAYDIDKDRQKAIKLFHNHLEKIYAEFNEILFNCETQEDFCDVFKYEMAGQSSMKLTAKSKSKFYYILHKMWESKYQQINAKCPGFTKESFFKPVLNNLNLSPNSFQNIDTISTNLKNKHGLFKTEVDAFF